MPVFSGSLIVAAKLEAKENFCMMICCFTFFQKFGH
jgi:hypothetical protein